MKKQEKKYGLFKGILLLIVVAILLSWLIPNGAFGSTGFQESNLQRIGLNDWSWLIYYGIYFAIDKIIFLLIVGGIYGILTKIPAYDKLVNGIAKKLSKHKSASVVILSTIIAVLTSLLTQTFVVILFIPFIISILNRMKLDKMSVLATTFGSMLVGILGATYGTEGLVYFNKYVTTDTMNINSTILIRFGILVVGLVLFNFFTLSHMKKKDKSSETIDMFPVELEEGNNKKTNIIPIVVIGVLTVLLTIFGYINWETNWNISAFNDFHTYLTEKIVLGDDFAIFKSLLGSNMGAFGAWDLFAMSAICILFVIILGLCYRVKLDEFFNNFANGAKKMLKPIICVVAAYTLMVVVYMSPYVATIINSLLGLTETFNLATMLMSSLITNIFHTDLGYTAYILSSYLTTEYPDYLNVIYVMFISVYGLVQFFVPTSIVLGIGLTSLDVKYKDWLKYIWKFIVGIFVCLLVLFILMALL